MAKNLGITAMILLLLAGFIFLGALFASILFVRWQPIAISQPLSLMPLSAQQLPSSENLSAFTPDFSQELDQLQEDVMGIRHLLPDETIYRDTLTPAQLRDRVVNDFFADYSDADLQRDTLIYALLGVIEPDFDLYNFIIDLYSEQIAGFYDDQQKEMVVVQGGAFGGPERMTYAHEFTHLLQDQNYDLEGGLNMTEALLSENMDAYAALQALVEGDAVMSEYLWYQDFATEEDTLDVQQFAMNMYTPVFDQAPAFMRNELLFPYQFGLEFVHSLYTQGGWQALEQLYENPPRSTEQIMHPERYPQDQPKAVTLADLEQAMPANYEKIAESTFGEAYLYLMLMSEQDEAAPDVTSVWEAAKGWGGDRYQLYLDDESGDVLFVLRTQWDTQTDAEEFMDAYVTYAQARWPEVSSREDVRSVDPNFGQVEMLRRQDETYWIFAADESNLNMVLNSLTLVRD